MKAGCIASIRMREDPDLVKTVFCRQERRNKSSIQSGMRQMRCFPRTAGFLQKKERKNDARNQRNQNQMPEYQKSEVTSTAKLG